MPADKILIGTSNGFQTNTNQFPDPTIQTLHGAIVCSRPA